MDAPEASGSRIGRTIWTVWGYLSGAVARYLRPEVTDEGNQSVRSRADDNDLKSAANKINREVKANDSEKEDKKYNQNDESTAEVKCSLPEVRVQVALVQWENTDVVKDDNNVELPVNTARKQTFHCAMWSAETDHEGSRLEGDSENQGCKNGVHVDKEEVSSNEVQAERVNESCKEIVNVQELDKTGQIEQKDGENEESDQKHEDKKCSKTEDPDNADATVQSEHYGQDVEQEILINMIDRGETENIGGFRHADEHLIDEMEKHIVGLKNLEKTETDEDQRSQSQVQDLLPEVDYSTEEAETESEQDTSVKTQQRVSKEISEKKVSNNETELKMTSVLDEIFETSTTSEDTLLLDSKQDTLEKISETGTGLPVVAIKNEGMFSDLIVCEFPRESRKVPETALGCLEDVETNLHELQSLDEEQTETETFVACFVEHPETQKADEEAVEIEQDIETPIEALDATESQTSQELDKTKFSLIKQAELRTELIVETAETKISSEDEEAELFETQCQRNVTLQTCELLHFPEKECKSSQETMDTFSESLGNSSISEITRTAKIEHVAEDQTDVKPVLTRTLSPAESLEETQVLRCESERYIEEQEPLDTDLRKSALEYVEKITNQVLKEMIGTEMVQKSETLVGRLPEELGNAEYQGPEERVSAGAFVLEEERKLLGEPMGSMVEMEMETASREVAHQNVLHISPECEATEADGHHEHQTFAGTDHGKSILCNTERDTHVENEAASSDKGQAERVYANSECKDSETALELDETGPIEQKDGNDVEYDQNHEDEKCEKKKEDANNTDTTVQSELYGQDVEQEMVINIMDSGETESIGGFRHADKHLNDEEEKNIVGQHAHEKTEIEDQGHELQVPADAFVLGEGNTLLGETMDSKIELEVENASSEVVKQNEQQSSPECETTEADGHHEQQTYLCAGTDHGGSISYDTEIDMHVENEAVSSDEGQAERVYANSECKDSETAPESDETGQIEQKDDNNDECDFNHEDERKKEDADNTDATVQSELYGQDVEQEVMIDMMGSGETESIGGLRHADEKDQNDHEKNETDEDQRSEIQVSADAFVLGEGKKLLGKTMDSKVELELEKACSEVVKQNEQHIISPECETTEADGHHEQQTYRCAGTDHGGSISYDTEIDMHVENEAVSSDEGQAERVYANSECKDSEAAPELDETGQIEQKDDNNDECDFNHEDERKKEDADNTDATVQSELYGQDVEQEVMIDMMGSGETESIGGLRHADEKDQNDHEKNETDEDQRPEIQVSADAFVLGEGKKLLGKTMDSKVELELEKACSDVVKQNEQHIISPECETTEADGHHEQQTYRCAGTDRGGSISCDTERDTHVENETISSNEGQSEEVYPNSECNESETAPELDETGPMEQKDGNDNEYDQNHEDEKKREEADNTDPTVQSKLDDIEQEMVINMDHGETESIGGFRPEDEKETPIFDQNVHDKEIENQLQVPADAFILEEESKLLGEVELAAMDSKIELKVENESSEVVKQNELQSLPESETTKADGHHEQIQKVIAGETELSHEDLMEISRPGMKRGFDRVSKDHPVAKAEGKYDLDLQAFEDSSLDFTVQKSRIAVKNPLVRPPKDPRKLLYMVSVEPLPPQPPACAQKAAVSTPSKGGIGFKLPGLGAGLPALRKTEFGKKAREGGEAERTLQPQKAVTVTEDSVKQEQASAKPKWTPPKHPGMGSPLMMTELKNKLKKPKE
ncbi:myb-like protein X isoform X2 [Pseudorasbora parva]|uniref:myb-like protein X isoform X2 n=1 Tax=Pseudorasbora parva TaxID=51549 RepID=UPI00351E29A3